MKRTCFPSPVPVLLLTVLVTSITAMEESMAGPVYEIKIGILDHDVDGLWSGSKIEEGDDLNLEIIFNSGANILSGTLRPNLGLSMNTSGDTSKVYGGGVLQYLWENGLFFDLGAGLAIHNGLLDEDGPVEEKELGSRILFRFSAEAGLSLATRHRFSLLFDHVSNGYLAEPNEGLDTLGVRYGYAF